MKRNQQSSNAADWHRLTAIGACMSAVCCWNVVIRRAFLCFHFFHIVTWFKTPQRLWWGIILSLRVRSNSDEVSVRHCWAVDISSATSVQLDTVDGRVGVRLLRPTTGQTPVDCLHRCLLVCSLLLESCHQACTSLLSFLSYCNLIQGNSLWCKIILPVRSAAWSTFQIKLHRKALDAVCYHQEKCPNSRQQRIFTSMFL